MIRNCFKLHKFLRDFTILLRSIFFFICMYTRPRALSHRVFGTVTQTKQHYFSSYFFFNDNWRSDRLHVFLFRILVNKFSNRFCIYELLHECIKEKFRHFIKSYFSYIFYQSFITSIFEIILNRYFHISLLQLLLSIYLIMTFNLC